MRVSELAARYARAAYGLATEAKEQEKVLSDLRALDEIFAKDPDVRKFLVSPLVKAHDREKVLEAAFKNSGVSPGVVQFVRLLVSKGRMGLFGQVVQAFQDQIDKTNGICRGTVRSSFVLAPAERQQIETIVEKSVKQKVIMTYRVDPAVIGGLVAQVGSFTFDDSLDSHLRRLNEELKRRTV